MRIRFIFLSALSLLFIISCTKNNSLIIKQAKDRRNLGIAYMRENKFTEAYKELEESKKLNPDDPHIHYCLGIFYYKKKDFDKALSEYKTSLKLKPDFAAAHNNIGLIYLHKKDWDTAIFHFKKLINNYVYATPQFPLTHLGTAYYNKKKYHIALTYYLKALDIDPDYANALIGIGNVYIALKDYDKALSFFNQAIEKKPHVEFLKKAQAQKKKVLKLMEEEAIW